MLRPMARVETGRSISPKEAERVREALRELLVIEKTQTALAKRLGVSQQALSAILRGTASGGYALGRAVARAMGASNPDAWLRGAAPGVIAPRIRDRRGYDEALVAARRMFKRATPTAFEAVSNLMGDNLPEFITAEFLGGLAMAWANSAEDDERAEEITAQAEREMEEEDRRAAVLASRAPASNDGHK